MIVLRMTRKPLLVLDFSVIRALPSSNILPQGDGYLLTDVVLHEVTGLLRSVDVTERDRASGMARKLGHVFRNNAPRIWIGQYWNEVSRRQYSPAVVLSQRHVINQELTSAIRGNAVDPDEWPSRMAELLHGRETAEFEEGRSKVIKLCEDWTAWVREHDPELLAELAQNPVAQREWVRRPDQISNWLVQQNERLRPPEWKDLVTRFPNRLAAGRWAQILLWQALQRSLNPDGKYHRFENSWDDAHYAFLASYTGRLATRDRDLKSMALALFDNVTVQDSLSA